MNSQITIAELNKICLDLEVNMAEVRDRINQPLGINDMAIPDDLEQSELLRNQVWENYYYMRKNKICSRCGNYNKYEITSSQTVAPNCRELNDRYHYNFYEIHYELKPTAILTKNSNDSEWGNVCSKCRDHILGKSKYELSSSKQDAERELSRLKHQERARQLIQDTEIEKAKKEVNKIRRENGGRPPTQKPTINPNDF